MFDNTKDLEKITVSIDKAWQQTFKQAKIKIGIAWKAWGEKNPSIDGLINQVFGEHGRLFHVLQEELGLSHSIFCKFMATFFFSAQLRVHVSTIYASERIDTCGLLSFEEFSSILRKISQHDCSTRGETIWMRVEEAFNAYAKRQFLDQRGDDDLFVALDDDKLH